MCYRCDGAEQIIELSRVPGKLPDLDGIGFASSMSLKEKVEYLDARVKEGRVLSEVANRVIVHYGEVIHELRKRALIESDLLRGSEWEIHSKKNHILKYIAVGTDSRFNDARMIKIASLLYEGVAHPSYDEFHISSDIKLIFDSMYCNLQYSTLNALKEFVASAGIKIIHHVTDFQIQEQKAKLEELMSFKNSIL